MGQKMGSHAPRKPRPSSAFARCNGRRRSEQVRAWKQTPNLDREDPSGVHWRCREFIETAGHHNEKSSSERETRLYLHACRPQQCTPPSTDRAAKRTWFNEARAPHPTAHRLSDSFFSFFFFCCTELKCNRLFCVCALPFPP